MSAAWLSFCRSVKLRETQPVWQSCSDPEIGHEPSYDETSWPLLNHQQKEGQSIWIGNWIRRTWKLKSIEKEPREGSTEATDHYPLALFRLMVSSFMRREKLREGEKREGKKNTKENHCWFTPAVKVPSSLWLVYFRHGPLSTDYMFTAPHTCTPRKKCSPARHACRRKLLIWHYFMFTTK